VFDKEFFATALPVAIGHYRAGVAAPAPQLVLTAMDGRDYLVRRVLAAAEGWASLEVVDDEHGPDEVALLFVPYEAIRRVVFDPKAAPDPQFGFRVHRPGEVAEPPDQAAPATPPTPPDLTAPSSPLRAPAAPAAPSLGGPPDLGSPPPNQP
jgi:hypothetical protein